VVQRGPECRTSRQGALIGHQKVRVPKEIQFVTRLARTFPAVSNARIEHPALVLAVTIVSIPSWLKPPVVLIEATTNGTPLYPELGNTTRATPFPSVIVSPNS